MLPVRTLMTPTLQATTVKLGARVGRFHKRPAVVIAFTVTCQYLKPQQCQTHACRYLHE